MELCILLSLKQPPSLSIVLLPDVFTATPSRVPYLHPKIKTSTSYNSFKTLQPQSLPEHLPPNLLPPYPVCYHILLKILLLPFKSIPACLLPISQNSFMPLHIPAPLGCISWCLQSVSVPFSFCSPSLEHSSP